MKKGYMTWLRNIFVAALGAALLISLSSCDHKDLCYGHPHLSRLRVVYDWRDAPEASPAGMCVFFYSISGDAYYRFDFNNTVGGEIELPVGFYRVITYNNDTELVKFSATNSFNDHLAFTRTADLLEPLYGNGVSSSATTDDGEGVKITPDGLWGCHVTDVAVEEHGVTYTYTPYDRSRSDSPNDTSSTDQIIRLYPHDMLCHYDYVVRNVENARYISRISASLSGMSGSLMLNDESLDSTPVTLPVGGQASAASNTITGNFLTFGQNPANAASHLMTFYVVMTDGSKYVVKGAPNLDVTSQVDNAPDRRNVHIVIDGLKLPTPGGDNPEGWFPTVDDWGVQHEELKI